LAGSIAGYPQYYAYKGIEAGYYGKTTKDADMFSKFVRYSYADEEYEERCHEGEYNEYQCSGYSPGNVFPDLYFKQLHACFDVAGKVCNKAVELEEFEDTFFQHRLKNLPVQYREKIGLLGHLLLAKAYHLFGCHDPVGGCKDLATQDDLEGRAEVHTVQRRGAGGASVLHTANVYGIEPDVTYR